MKKLFYLLLAAPMLLMTACSEKFDVAAPYKDITVVYGFLDMGDTAHYVRIQKAFLDENKSALTMAQSADSSFYNNISVRIDRYNVVAPNNYIDSIHLNRVDLTAEGYPKQPGVFFTSPNYAYKFVGTLNPQYVYRLKITHLATGKVDSATSPVISNQYPTANGFPGFVLEAVDDTSINLAGMSFYSALQYRYIFVNASYTPPFNYSYNGETSPAKVAQAVIRFNYEDFNTVTKTKVRKYVDYDAGLIPIATTNFEYKIENRTLYNALATGMGKAPDNVQRLLDRCDYTLYLSTSDYNTYRQAIQSQGNGLTGNEIAPLYTNIKGENVLGLYTARGVRSGKITITPRTVDSLIASPILSNANIRGTVY